MGILVDSDYDFQSVSRLLSLPAPTASGHAMRYDEFGANFNQMTTTGAPQFGSLTLLSTGTQLSLCYDSSHKATFAVNSAGKLTITPTDSSNIVFSGNYSGGTLLSINNTNAGASSYAGFQVKSDTISGNFLGFSSGYGGGLANSFGFYTGGSWPLWLGVNGSPVVWISTAGHLGVQAGSSPPSALTSFDTTEPFRIGYDSTHYLRAVTTSTGDTTLNPVNGANVGTLSVTGAAFAKKVIVASFGDGVSVPSAGTATGSVICPVAGTIVGVRVISGGGVSGSAVIDIWKSAYGNTPTVANTITASALPTLSSAVMSKDDTLTGWTTSVAANDVFVFNLNSVSTCTYLICELVIAVTGG